jgi:hypothetical protein
MKSDDGDVIARNEIIGKNTALTSRLNRPKGKITGNALVQK